jgi:multidrug resistance protein MdtO
MLFITRIVLWRYRARLPGFELPEPIQQAEQEFDRHLAAALEGTADRLDGNGPTPMDDWTNAYAQLEEAVWKASPQSHQLTPQIQWFLLLSRRIADLADSLKKEI